MKTRTAIFVAVSVALGFASPALFAQGEKPTVTNPGVGQAKQATQAKQAKQAKKQADKNDDMLAGRKGAAKAQMGSGQGQQGPGQRKMEAKTQKGSGQGQQGFGGQRKAQMGDGQGQQGFGGQRQMQSKGGLAGGGDQFHKGGAASQSKAAQMHK